MIVAADTDIAHLNTFRIPAKCARLVVLQTPREIAEVCHPQQRSHPAKVEPAVAQLQQQDKSDLFPTPLMQIGEGSNLLFVSDFHGTIIISDCKNFRIYPADPTQDEAEATDFLVEAEAGLSLDALCEAVAQRGLWGLENLSGIPGTVGAAPVQNVGAYGIEAKDVIINAYVYDRSDDAFKYLDNEQMHFGYRQSIFKEDVYRNRYFVCRVTFKVTRKPEPRLGYSGLAERARKFAVDGEITPMSVRKTVLEIRAEKLPDVHHFGSAGSFFKNPVIDNDLCNTILEQHPDMPHYPIDHGKSKLSAAWLIDHAGCKELKVGGAAIWPKQPLIIYNADNATGADVVALERLIIKRVKEKFGIDLHPEVVHVP